MNVNDILEKFNQYKLITDFEINNENNENTVNFKESTLFKQKSILKDKFNLNVDSYDINYMILNALLIEAESNPIDYINSEFIRNFIKSYDFTTEETYDYDFENSLGSALDIKFNYNYNIIDYDLNNITINMELLKNLVSGIDNIINNTHILDVYINDVKVKRTFIENGIVTLNSKLVLDSDYVLEISNYIYEDNSSIFENELTGLISLGFVNAQGEIIYSLSNIDIVNEYNNDKKPIKIIQIDDVIAPSFDFDSWNINVLAGILTEDDSFYIKYNTVYDDTILYKNIYEIMGGTNYQGNEYENIIPYVDRNLFFENIAYFEADIRLT